MCDQTEVQYLPGEVVWVKLRALWWPGLVQDYDSLPEEITCSLRKRPIATVKFFQEDSYEYVHKLDLIYHYNCSRKNEFIKKGLDLCRKKSADRPATMDFFPMDIVTAEERTGGDPNILQDKAFRPDEKPKYNSLFGEQKKFGKKKGKEDSPLKDKVAHRKKLTSKLQAMGWLSRGVTANIIYPSPDTPRIVTHRRFLNKARNPDAKSDYESRIMEQKCEDDTSCLMDKEYQCVMCGYITRRLNVIVLHFNSTHSLRTKNIFPTPSILKGGSLRNPLLKLKESRKSDGGKSSILSKKRTSVRSKIEKPKKEESEEELSEEEPPKPLPVKKEKGKPGRKRKVKPEVKTEEETTETTKKPKVLDSLLADWDEDDADQNETDDLEKSQIDDGEKEGDEDGDVALNESGDKSSASMDTSTASKSKEVFEFDPDEDDSIDFDLTPNVKGFGRRIPRVIESSKDKKGKSDSKKPSKEKSDKKKQEEDIDDFESLLAETSVPSLPAVPKSSTFSMDTEDDLDSKLDESSSRSVLKEQNDAVEESAKMVEDKKSKNSEPEVDLAVDPNDPPQEQEQTNTAKVTVQMIPDIASAGSNINVGDALSGNDASPSEGKSSSGDHTYVSGNSGRKRRRHLLPLEKHDSPGGMSMSDDDFMVEESPRKSKQPYLPKVEGSNVVIKPTPRRGRPPKKGRGAKGAKALMTSTPQLSSKTPAPVVSSKRPSARTSSMSPPPVPSPKSPPPYQSPKSPVTDQPPKSPSQRHSSKSPTLSPIRQAPKSPIHVAMSPGGPKSPQPHLSPKSPRSPQAYQSPIHQGPKSPQGLQGPKSPQGLQAPKSPQGLQGQKSLPGLQGPKSPQGIKNPKSPIPTLLSSKSLKTPTLFTPDEPKTIRSPPRSIMKSPPAEVQAAAGSKSPVKSPLPSPTASQASLISPLSPRSTGSKIVLQTSPVKVTAGLKKISTPGAVVVQSKPDLQPEACGLGKIIASTPTAIATGSPGTVKTIKVAVSGSSPMVVTKPGSTPRKVMIVQGKGGTQKIMVPTEASQQLLSNIGSGKKIMVITKGSPGSPSKLVLTSQQQKILAAGGKITTSTGQTITSKGSVMSSVTKLVTAKPSTSTSFSSGVELSPEPPALIKTDGKKTYKIITTPQSKGNILLNTSAGQILVPVSSIGASGSGVTTASGSKQFILPVGAKQMKLLNTAGGTGQKVILHMKSSTAKAGLPASPKTVQTIVPKTVVQSITPKTIQTISPKLVQTISSKTIQSITPKSVLPITPKTSQPMKVTTIATTMQPVPHLTPIGAPKTPRLKQVKATVAKPTKTPPQPKSPRKTVTLAKTVPPAGVTTSSTTSTPVLLPASSPLKRNTGIVPNPSLKPIAPQAAATKKISLAAKPAPVETPVMSTVPGTMQVVTSAVPGLEQIQTNLLSSVESSAAMTLPTSTQQLVAVPTEDGGQVMYLIDNSSLLGLDSTGQGNLGNIILSFDNMGQPTASSASDFTFSTPSSGQDILAEALANTDLQSEAGTELSLETSGLLSSHSSSMYPPTLSHGVLETSLTLNQPIMTPLEDLSGISTLQPPPSSGVTTSVELPTISVPDITISTSSYSSLPIPSATIQSTVFSEAQNVPTYTTTSADGNVFIEGPTEGESFLTTDVVYEQTSEGASMPLLDG